MSLPGVEGRAVQSREWIRAVAEYGVKVAAQKGMPSGQKGAFWIGCLMMDAAVEWMRASGMTDAVIAEYARVASGGHEDSVRWR